MKNPNSYFANILLFLTFTYLQEEVGSWLFYEVYKNIETNFLLSQYTATGARYSTLNAPRIMVTRKGFKMIFPAKT